MAGKIPRAFIDEVLDRVSLVDYIDSHVSLTKRGKNYLACCPFHNEKTPSFNVIPDKQFYYCFGCSASGNAISFAMNYLHKDFVTAIEDLAGQVGLTVPVEASRDQPPQSKQVYGFLDEVCQSYQTALSQHPAAASYLANRGLNAATIAHFQIGFAPDDWHYLDKQFPGQQENLLKTGMLVKNDKGNIYDRYRNRIMFPIHDKRGRTIGFGGRVIDSAGQPKYLNSPETPYFHKSRELYGLHHLQKSDPEFILVVEGYMDVVALYQHGIKNVVATLGTATTSSHIQSLFRVTSKLIFCFDGDKAGRRAAERALELCMPLVQDNQSIHFLFLADGEDPDSLVNQAGSQAFLEQLKQAPSLAQYFFQNLQSQVNSKDLNGRSKLVHIAKPLLTAMPKSAFRELILDQLALLARIERHRLDELVNNSQPVPSEQTQQLHHNRPKPSALRFAIALLIQQPELFSQIKDNVNTELLSQNENPILAKLLDILPSVSNTAQLLEHWRNTEQYAIVSKLAILALNLPESGLVAELLGAIKQIEKNTLQTQIDRLLYKANVEGLSTQQKQQLQALIRQQKQFAEPSTF